MQVIVERFRNNTFLARGESRHWVVLDTKTEYGGSAAASSPMELLLFALGGCTGMDVESLLQKMRTPVEGFRIVIAAERREEHPRVYTTIHLTYQFWGENLNRVNIEKAIELSQHKYCSVSAMLSQAAQLTYSIELNPSR